MSKRRSSRLKSASTAITQASTSAANDDGDVAALSEEEFIQKPKWKKQKVKTSAGEGKQGAGQAAKSTTRRVRGKRGVLEQLTEMPLDVLLEIFGQLNPIDLIHITRTTKQLRAILLDHSSIAIWKQALSNVPELPRCLDGMSEPAYVHLMFEMVCNRCLAKNTQTVFWDIKERLCHKCLESSDDFMLTEVIDLKFNLLIDGGAPTDIFPIMMFSTGGGRHRQTRSITDTVSVVHINEEYSNTAESDRAVWVQEHKACLEEQRKRTRECEDWLNQRAELRASELENIREQRRNEIIKRLTDLGWGEEFEIMGRTHLINHHALVWQKKALTDRIWNNICDELIHFMQDTKEERIAKAEREKLKVRQPLLMVFREKVYEPMKPINSIIPPAADLFAFEPFRRVMEDTPGTVNLTGDDLADVMDGLDAFCEQWLSGRKHELLRMLVNGPVTKEDLENAETILRHPTTIFHCGPCLDDIVIWYPRVLVHHHAIDRDRYYGREYHSESMHALFSNLSESSWNAFHKISVDPQYKPRAEIVIEICGVDVASATVEELDTLDPILECLTCNSVSDSNVRHFMTWRSAITHKCSRDHYQSVSQVEGAFPGLTLTDDLMTGIIRERKFEQHLEGKDRFWCIDRRRYICVACRTKCRPNAMKAHLASEHGKTTVSPEDFVYNMADDDDFFTYSYPTDTLNLRAIRMKKPQILNG